ncbi:Hypothetical Protein FCC1311_038812 [Hondaea fermentalgiana]|uniref:Uncharacterized protein n=1 Tax=Hondaea fermentalgiana TaxID=2315210 RepID=A0A2R5GD60_9STRA|nr:Hypothetical Protein FCC1311_038812 [Hondaea fermentalgiana]|eukprot:GBG27658.1 Hypothetical Protein FCC1311_038812 [Hondaea fermentalgiana]
MAGNVRALSSGGKPVIDEETDHILGTIGETAKKVVTDPAGAKKAIEDELQFVPPLENYLEDKRPPELHRWGGDQHRKSFNAANGSSDHSLDDGTYEEATPDGPMTKETSQTPEGSDV